MKPVLIHELPIKLADGKTELMNFEVWPRVRRSGYEHLVLQTTIDLMQKGFITTINHEPDHMLFGLRDDNGDPVSYIVLDPKPSQELVHIVLGGTVPERHGQGLYQQLYFRMAYMISLTSDLFPGVEVIRKITGCYHVQNHQAARMNAALGRQPVRINTEQTLGDAVEKMYEKS